MTASLYLWSKTAADNDDADGAINWVEGQAPSAVNNSARAMMAAIANYRDDIGGALVSTGSGNEYTITTNQGLAAHANGVFITFRADKTSTGAATTTIDGLAQKSILRSDGTATESGDIVSGGIYSLRYSSVGDGYIASISIALTATLTAISALAVTDSNIIVGNGTTWVAETGATARTSLGVGTGNSPQFTGIELGHATDTTVSRSSAGVMAVEGVTVPLNSVSNTHTAQQIELGHATDTTLSRSAAGVLAVEGTAVPLVTQAVTEPQGRLTLTTATPVQVSEATAATTIYYTPYKGIYFPAWNGTLTLMKSFASERSLALSSNAGHTGYHQSGKNFDLFLYDDSGTVRLVSGPAWTNDTTRATALAYKNGFLTNGASMTARFGSASGNTVTVDTNYGLFVGTFRASANGQTIWTSNPAAAAGGGNCRLFLWNMYNRVAVAALSRDSTDTWTYTTKTWRSANNNNSNRVSLVVGLNEESVLSRYTAGAIASGADGTAIYAGVGINSTSAVSGLVSFTRAVTGSVATNTLAYGEYAGPLADIGLQFIQALEASDASGTTTWQGDNGDPTFRQTGLILNTRM